MRFGVGRVVLIFSLSFFSTSMHAISSPLTSTLFSHRLMTSLHSNPSMIQPDAALLSQYLDDLGNSNNLITNTQEKGFKWSVTLDSTGDWLYEIGDIGGFYHRFAYLAHIHQVKNSILLDSYLFYGSYTLGHVGFLGALEWQIQLGALYNGVVFDNRIDTPLQSYFGFGPSYAYRWQNGSILTLEFKHAQSQAFQPQNTTYSLHDINGTYVGEQTYEQKLRRDFNTLLLRLEGNIFTADSYIFELGVGGFNGFENYYAKFSSFNQHHIALGYVWQLTQLMRLKLDSSLTTRNFGSLVYNEPYYGLTNGYDYANDPLKILRKDHIMQVKTELFWAHDTQWNSSLSYALTVTETNFPAIDKLTHELSYAIYWLP